MIQSFIETPQGRVEADVVIKPQERTFRDAWQLNGVIIEVDMEQAKEIWRDKIRAARKPELERLDADYMKALEAGDTSLQQQIALQKQALRDATGDPAIALATTPDELQMIQPAGLSLN